MKRLFILLALLIVISCRKSNDDNPKCRYDIRNFTKNNIVVIWENENTKEPVTEILKPNFNTLKTKTK
jgi:hypothetical protein